MKNLPRLLAIILALLITLTAVSVPVLAEDAVAKYPNTETFSWGVNGHVTYSGGDIDNYMALAAKMGAKLYRVDLPSIGFLASADKIVRAANAYGIDVMLVVGGNELTADEVTSLYGQVARHYATGDFGTVKYIQIFNETETSALIDGDNVDATVAANYDADKIAANAELFKAAYNAIKAVSSDYITVVNYGWKHDPYLSLLADAGVQWDVTGINWYTNMETTAADGLDTALSRLAADTDLASKKVIVTEANVWLGSTTITDELSAIMDTAYNSEKVIGMCFYELLDEPEHELENERAYGLVNYSAETGIGEVKEIYTSVQSLIGGSDAVTKGEFTPSAAYPDGTTTYTKEVAVDGILTVSSGSGNISLEQDYYALDYDAVELDIYLESADTTEGATGTLNVILQSTDWTSCVRKANITVPVNQWVHKIIYIDSFLNYASGSYDFSRLSVDGVAAGNTANIVNAAFVTGVEPEMKNTYNLAKEVGYELHYTQIGFTATDRTNKTIGETINFKSYDYLEFDVKIDSNGTEYASASFQVFLRDTNGAVQLKSFSANTDEWVHITTAAPSGWSYGSGDISAVAAIQLDLLKAYPGCTFHIANMALTNFAPEADYTYNLGKELDVSLNYSGTDPWAIKSLMQIGESVDITAYDYLEFDLYVDAGTTGLTNEDLLFYYIDSTNANANSGRGQTVLSFETNKWVHYAIKTDSFNTGYEMNGNPKDVVAFMLDSLVTGGTHHIANMALTNFAPEADYTYYLGKELDYSLDLTYAGDCWVSYKTIGDTVSFSNYDYLEMDVYVESTTVTEQTIRLHPSKDKTDRSRYDVKVATNQWVHLAIPMSSFISMSTAGGLTDTAYFMIGAEFIVKGDTYHIANMAVTLAEEPAAVTWGDANGDGAVDVLDYIRMKKLISGADDGEYVLEDDEYLYADFDEDGIIGAEDLVVMKKYLLGVITSLNPADLA